MADNTKISWAKHTWNPIAGCDIESPGCKICYAMRRVAPRLASNPATPQYHGTVKKTKTGYVWTGKIGIAGPKVWERPFKWRKPAAIFVNSTSDLFHPSVPDDVRDRVMATAALNPRHIFQILTKRPGVMQEYLCQHAIDGYGGGSRSNGPLNDRFDTNTRVVLRACEIHGGFPDTRIPWPLSNIWLGTSVEDQKRADERFAPMRELAADGWNTWVSYEPALGSVSWNGWEFIKWMVSGGESGDGARPSHPDWHCFTRDWCGKHAIDYHFKQWGAFYPVHRSDLDEYGDWIGDGPRPHIESVNGTDECGYYCSEEHGHIDHRACFMKRIGSKAAGRQLDGQTHDAMPGDLT